MSQFHQNMLLHKESTLLTVNYYKSRPIKSETNWSDGPHRRPHGDRRSGDSPEVSRVHRVQSTYWFTTHAFFLSRLLSSEILPNVTDQKTIF
jgi:hypothetical protein